MTASAYDVGDVVDAVVGPVAHGGHFVARVPAGEREIVVFVRHALPDEKVRVRITEVDSSFLRGDAIEVLEASPHRVGAPCPLAHPDGCGGCDFQHVAVPHQRVLKGAVLREQLQRLAGVDRDVVVEAVPVPGRPDDGLGWRTRMQYVPLPHGARGLRKHRSHDVVPVEDCPIEAADVRVTEVGEHSQRLTSHEVITESVLGRRFEVAADGFWQVHPEAPRVLVEAVLDALRPSEGERAVDLFAGVGLFSAFLASAVGSSGSVLSVEGDRRASELAAANRAAYPWVEVRQGRGGRVLHHRTRRVGATSDVVVLDPPRTGVKRQVVRAVTALEPRAVAYVACDPAALARDVAYFDETGYRLTSLRAFDLFPMTHHVECVALLTHHSNL
jgi:tRNA/tmRNA/rRNA uracil-C5-methylase (TrmA/RlmC/RlmD family)